MNFDESIAYLLALGNEVSAMKLGLENIGKLLAALGNPEKNYVKIQIAGTNGKGSTCAFLEAICVCAKIKTGLTTSPHLISVTERIKIDGREIGEKDFARHATKIRELSEQIAAENKLETVPTYFEQLTAIALNAFAEAKVELAILETGLGGRFDATTAANAEIVAITPIDFDHQQILGNTLAEIASEKAAIIREDTKVIVAPQPSHAVQIIQEKCREVGVKPIFIQSDVEVNQLVDKDALEVTITTKTDVYSRLRLSLAGRHQFVNASLAVEIAETLRDVGFKITPDNVINGLETAKHNGRLEFSHGILFDGAHNIAGAKALKNYFDEFITQPITLVFGVMRDKDLPEIAEILFPKAKNLIFTKPDNPRSMQTADLMKFLPQGFVKDNVYQTETVEKALETGKKISSAEDLICVTGSLYLVGEAQRLLIESNEKRAFA